MYKEQDRRRERPSRIYRHPTQMELEVSGSHKLMMKRIRKNRWKSMGAFTHPKYQLSASASSQQK
jgi:hypothetical protein